MIIVVCMIDDRYIEKKKIITSRSVIALPTRYSTSPFPQLLILDLFQNLDNWKYACKGVF